MIVQVPAKINLHLGVGDLRDDGYHELTTVFQSLSLYDRISAYPADELTLTVSGEGAHLVPTDETNLAHRAATLLAETIGRTPGARLEIAKGIPVAGGMAGGSADAAGTLLALNRLWRAGLSREELHALAAQLGSDVPFMLTGGTALGTGRGEELTTVLARGSFHWVIAMADGGLSTPEVFGELDRLRGKGAPPRVGDPAPVLQAVAAGDAGALAGALGNDLQAAAVTLLPRLRRTLDAGRRAGALAGIVSGSGPTCVFLCADHESAMTVSVDLVGEGACRTVRLATGPAGGATVLDPVTGEVKERP